MYSLASVVNALFNFFELLIVAWCVMSWVPRKEGGIVDDVASVLERIVGPYLSLFRRLVPPIAGIDFTPVVAVIVLGLVQRVVVGILI